MAVTLLSHATVAIAERYAEFKGHRIPCERKRVAYHLNPYAADRCCGPSYWLTLKIVRQFKDLAPILEALPWVSLVGRD